MATPLRTPPGTAGPARYGVVASALHWLIGIALLGQIGFGFLLDEIAPRNTPPRAAVINLHKSFGVTLAVLIVLRIAWRLAHRAPAPMASLPAWQQRASTLGHRALYACMVVMPTSGYIASNFSKYGVKFYGIALAPWGGDIPAVYRVFNLIHITTAWVFTALIVGHIAMALKHSMIDGNGIMARVWPWAGR